MKIFVFGAGASLAAQNPSSYGKGHNQRAPLVDELFNEEYEASMVEGIEFDLPSIRKEVEKIGSVEKWLTVKWEGISSLKTERKKQTERSLFGRLTIYLWNVLNSVSQTYPDAQGYSKLLVKLHKDDEDFSLVSFNYDTLLDRSYQDVFNDSLVRLDDYLSSGLIKLHGSTNWFLGKREEDPKFGHREHGGDRVVRLGHITKRMLNGPPMSMGSLQVLDPGFSGLRNLSSVMDYFSGDNFYPLMFLPLSGKLYEVVADFSGKITAKAEELFQKATDVFLIGYSANDELIHSLLEKVPNQTLLHIVGKALAKDISTRVRSMHFNLKEGKVFSDGLMSFIDEY